MKFEKRGPKTSVKFVSSKITPPYCAVSLPSRVHCSKNMADFAGSTVYKYDGKTKFYAMKSFENNKNNLRV